MPLALFLIGFLLLIAAVVYLVVSTFRFRGTKREHNRRIEGLPQEERELYGQREQYRAELKAANKEHEEAVRQAEKELNRATSDHDKRVRQARSNLESAQQAGRKQIDSLRGRNGTLKLFEDRVEAPEATIGFAEGRVKTKVEARGRLYNDGRDTREVWTQGTTKRC